MNVYTDPKLLDVSGALDELPPLSLTTGPDKTPERVSHTGTDDPGILQLAPVLAPGTVKTRQSVSAGDTLSKIDETAVGNFAKPQTAENPTKKGSFPRIENEPLKRPRGDLNPQPPDRQSGALTN